VTSRSAPYVAGAPTVAELASGAVVVARGDGRVLLLHDPTEDRWCFPKGHVEPGESLLAAARREVVEETGIDDLAWYGEVAEVHYRFFQPATARNVLKTAVYFLASAGRSGVRLEATFDRGSWERPGAALRTITYPLDRLVLVRALGAMERARLLPRGLALAGRTPPSG
jgi:8-oxo-dGTP pyrophosphatase MutT (NUDIX family)